MTERSQAEEVIFLAALERATPEERAAYIEDACGARSDLRQRVEELLRCHEEPDGPLDTPPAGVAATLDVPSLTERPGQTIGHYKLLEEIGKGGMAVVYMAEQREPVRRKVALKIIKPGMDTREVIARFEAERQALAMMDHLNIAKVFDAGETASGRSYFVMELIHGIPLTDYCDQNELTIRERLELFAQVCHAVQHAHQKGIIHRDLKPSNVMVTLYDGVPIPKIIDFGVAKATTGRLTERSVFTHFGQMIGTPLYMSPEQAEMGGLDVDTRSDIYSLGMMLYELLAGSKPFDEERVQKAGYDELCRMIREDEPPRPSARISTLGAAATTISTHRKTDPVKLSQLLHRDLDWIVMKAIQKDRTRRYQTAADFAQDIERYLHDEPVEARPPSLADRAAKWARRHRPLVASAVILLILSTIALGVSTLLIAHERSRTEEAYKEKDQQLTATQKAEKLAKEQEGLAKQQEQAAKQQAALAKEQQQLAKEQKEEADRQREISDGNLYVAHMRQAERDWEQGQIGRLHEMLDSHFPQPGQPDLRGWEWYYYLALCHREVMTLFGNSSGVLSVAWSPDGTRLASACGDGEIRIWDAATRQQIHTLTAGKDYGNHQLAWSPDGKRLASADQAVWIWDLAVGKAVGFHWRVCSVAWSPDGERLAAGDEREAVKIWDTTSGNEILNLTNKASYPVAWSPDGKRLATGKPGGENNGHFQIVDALKGHEILSFSPQGAQLQALAWSPDGNRLACGGYGNWVRVWDVATGREQFKLWHSGAVGSLAWSPDGKRLATASWAQEIIVWDATTGREALTLRGHRGRINSVSWSPDGKQLASAGDDGTVKVWDARGEREPPVMAGARAVRLAWSPQGRRLAWAGGGKVTLWDAKRGEEVVLSDADAEQVLWSPGGKHLAVGKPGGIVILDVEARKESRTLASRDLKSVAWSPDGTRLALALAGSHAAVEVWDVAKGQKVITRQATSPTSVAWSPDGSRVASDDNGVVLVWDVATSKEQLAFRGHTGGRPIHSVAWSPDGKWLASGGWDDWIKVWDASTGRALRTLTGHTGTVRVVAWSPDSKRLASASEDGTVRVWDPSTGQELISLPGSFAAWSSDGQCLATIGDPSGTIRIWDASSGYAFARGVDYQVEISRARLCAQILRARADYSTGAWDDAITELTDAVRLNPKSELAYHIRGAAHLNRRDYDKAIADFNEAIRLDAGNAHFYDHRGNAYSGKGEYIKAIGDFSDAIRLAPKYATPYIGRAAVYDKKGEYDKAVADFTEAIRLDPKVADWYAKRASVYEKKGDHDKAIADLAEALRLDPKVAVWYLGRGMVYNKKKRDYDKAIADFNEAIRLDAGMGLAYGGRGQAYAGKGKCIEAIADFTEAIRLEPRKASHYFFRGQAYFDKALFNEAEADFNQAMRIEPANRNCYTFLVAVHLEKGDCDRAIADLLKAIEHEPENAGLWNMRVLAPLAAGRPDEYRKALAEMIQRLGKSEDPRAACLVSWASVMKPDSAADWQSVLAMAERAVRREPGSSACLAALGMALYRTGSYEQAAQRLGEADRLIRDPSEIADYSPACKWFFLAMAHHRLGHAAEAKKWLDKAGQWVERATGELQAGILRRNQFGLNRRLALKLFQEETEALLGVKAAPLADPSPPQSAESHRNRGRELAKKGDLGEAIAAYRAAIRLDPMMPSYFRERGVVYAGKGEVAEAIADFREVLRLDSTRTGSSLGWLSVWLPGVMRGTGKPSEIVYAADMSSIKSTGAKGPLAEPPDELRSATEANAALLLTEVHGRLGHKDLARRWFDKAATWMDKNKTEAEGLRRYRAEAEKALGINEKQK